MDYAGFLASKQKAVVNSGFHVETSELNYHLFEFQKFIVQRALLRGKYAVFADCGLGKTLMQLEFARLVNQRTGGRVLILAPLAVSGQTIQEGAKFGIPVCRYDGSNSPIQIVNYDQLDNINSSSFSGVVLDESSILKNYEGATKKKLLEMFFNTPYKLCATATPSPNDPMELGNHAEFLGVMSRSEMLAAYFVHDGGETAKWRLKNHAVKSFFQFVGSWSIMLNNPADIGFTMNGYDLPRLHIIERQIATSARGDALFNDTAISATEFNGELRATKKERIDEVQKIVNLHPDENFIIWIKHNEEGEMLRSILQDCREVKGNDTIEYKEKTLLAFAKNEFRILITKSKIASFGMNFQNCRNQIFASLDFSFEGLYQSIRRSYRFGQKEEVRIFLITTDTMTNVIKSINVKQNNFLKMQKEMSEAVNVVLSGAGAMKEIEHSTAEIHNELYSIKRGDCVELIKELPDSSIGLTVFSPPFADLYTYSSYLEDMGNCRDYNEFLLQFKYLVEELYRVTITGRNVCVHCMDLPIQKGKEGYIGLRDFSGMILAAFQDAGFVYHSRVTIWKDPVVEMQRTKALGLLHKQVKKDSTKSRVGIPDYVLIFRKDGESKLPVLNTDLSVDLWQKYASPVWMDIDYGHTLQGFRNAKDEQDEKHICPLQLGTIERLIHLYSNVGDSVFTPFMGIGSEVYQAVKMGRFGVGFELKESYFNAAAKNVASAAASLSQQTLIYEKI